jgi:hypothetical protein
VALLLLPKLPVSASQNRNAATTYITIASYGIN